MRYKFHGPDFDAKLRRHHDMTGLPTFPFQATMPLSIFRRLLTWRPLLFYAVAWTVLLTATMAVASFSAKIAFVLAVSPSSSFSPPCNVVGPRIPVEIVCLPVHLVKRSGLDVIVPTVFVASVVAGSACMIRAVGL
ncbi:unnamed protein product [Ilex paraguariensis]|uniref:Uncharacterized protein n=3 Tax=Ilex paraguariensis TaxID=185542 RepID=A0ABC8R5B0_9AQUA